MPAQIIDGRAFVPLRFVSEALGAPVAWDGANRAITITSDVLVGQGGIREHTWPNGDHYTGQWKGDVQHGEGTYTWFNGDKYSGDWQDGQLHGWGTYTWINGERYTGEWLYDQRTGQGTYTWTDGSHYVGGFVGGLQHGHGIYTWPDGTQFAGEWDQNKLVGPDDTASTLIPTPTDDNLPDTIVTRMAGSFEGWSGDTIFKLANGQIWQQASFAFTYTYKYRPEVVIFRSGSRYKMAVDGVRDTIYVHKLEAIESRIAGSFEGWSGDTIFTLTNGQIWQQASYAYTYSYRYAPEVIIYKSGAGYKMQVDGVNGSIYVKRLK